jgi:hypothetical protein
MKRCLAAFAIAASQFAPVAHADDALETKVRAYVPVFSLAKVCDFRIMTPPRMTTGPYSPMRGTIRQPRSQGQLRSPPAHLCERSGQ